MAKFSGREPGGSRTAKRRIGGTVARRSRVSLAAVVGIAAALLLAGCTSGASTSSDTAMGDSAQDAPALNEADSAGGAESGFASDAGPADESDSSGRAPGAGAGLTLVDDRQIVRTATLDLQVRVSEGKDDESTRTALAEGASGAATKVRALATGTGGYVSASDGSGATVSVTMRVPTAGYSSVMRALANIGEVTSQTEATQDVTDEMVDVTSRLATMKASVDRIRALLASADKLSEVISIESELTKREADLESLQNRQAALQNQVALSTITVTITAVTGKATSGGDQGDKNGFLAGLAAGWHALSVFGTGVAAVIGALLPWLPPAAIVIAVLIWIIRRRRPRPAPTAPTTPPTADTSTTAAPPTADTSTTAAPSPPPSPPPPPSPGDR